MPTNTLLTSARPWFRGVFPKCGTLCRLDHWMGYGGMNFPSKPDSVVSGDWVYSCSAASFGYRHFDSIKHELSDVPSIVVLIDHVSPPTVRRLIVSGRIDTVYRHSWWPSPHIFGKRVKRFAPPITHRYPILPVVFVADIGWLVASPQHSPPNFVSLLVVDRSPASVAIYKFFFPKTSAALRLLKPQPTSATSYGISTVAFAQPCGRRSYVCGSA